MPANIVVGAEAERVADFVARYSGRKPGEEKVNPGQENQP